MLKYSIAVAELPEIAAQLDLPLVDINTTLYDFILTKVNEKLVLRKLIKPTNDLVLDFCAGKIKYRRIKGGSELIIKATGINKNKNLSVIDATAGFGRDAYVMACHGAKVTMIEQNKIVAALLTDALQRLQTIEPMPLDLIIENSLDYLAHIEHLPDVIYLDPMYPEKKKSALVKKEMQLLQTIVEVDHNPEILLQAALSKAKQRVVVKRPRTAIYLGNLQPNFSIEGKAHRFDVYRIHS